MLEIYLPGCGDSKAMRNCISITVQATYEHNTHNFIHLTPIWQLDRIIIFRDHILEKYYRGTLWIGRIHTYKDGACENMIINKTMNTKSIDSNMNSSIDLYKVLLSVRYILIIEFNR